jgi:prolipoprotein diacylglyceryltransferase
LALFTQRAQILYLFGIERPIGAYEVCLALAISTGVALLLRAAHRARLDLGAVIATIGLVILTGFMGTTLLSIVVEWLRSGSISHALQQGGMVFFGGFIGGIIGLWIGCRLFMLPFGSNTFQSNFL